MSALKKFDVHVCLVSDQPIPNFVPVLAKEFRPSEVILLVTEKMQAKAKLLEDIMRERCGVKVQQMNVPDAYDMSKISDEVFKLLLNIDKQKVALNVTGGTKLMAIAAFEMFRNEGYASFYFTANSNEVLLLDDNQRFVLSPSKMKIEDYLILHGYPAVDEVQRKADYDQEIGEEIIRNHQAWADELSRLNYEISQGSEKDKSALSIAIPDAKNSTSWDDLLYLLQSKNLLSCDGDKLKFPDLAAKQYVAGGWFEEYVFNLVRTLDGIQDCALNVQIENAREKTHQNNELDIVFLANNVLHVLECKTANFSKNEEKAKDALYKLETLKKLGGLRTQAAMVSYHALTPIIRDRAEGARIKIIEKKDITGIKTILGKWINGE